MAGVLPVPTFRTRVLSSNPIDASETLEPKAQLKRGKIEIEILAVASSRLLSVTLSLSFKARSDGDDNFTDCYRKSLPVSVLIVLKDVPETSTFSGPRMSSG